MNQLTQQCAELCRSEDSKIPELEGDVGTLHKTHNVYLSTSAGTSKGVRKNMNLNKLFEKLYTPNTSKDLMLIPPQVTTGLDYSLKTTACRKKTCSCIEFYYQFTLDGIYGHRDKFICDLSYIF